MGGFYSNGNEGYPTQSQNTGPSPYEVQAPNYPAQPWYQGERFRHDPFVMQALAQEYAYTHRGLQDKDQILYDVYSPQLFSRPIAQQPPAVSYPSQDRYGSER